MLFIFSGDSRAASDAGTGLNNFLGIEWDATKIFAFLQGVGIILLAAAPLWQNQAGRRLGGENRRDPNEQQNDDNFYVGLSLCHL